MTDEGDDDSMQIKDDSHCTYHFGVCVAWGLGGGIGRESLACGKDSAGEWINSQTELTIQRLDFCFFRR